MNVDRGIFEDRSSVLQHLDVGDLKRNQQRRLKRCDSLVGKTQESSVQGSNEAAFEGGEIIICVQ